MSAIFQAAQLAYTYEPVPVNNTNTTVISANINTSGAASFFPFILPGPVAVGQINLIQSMSFVTVGAASGRQTQSISYGLYSRGTGTQSTTIGTFTSGLYSLAVTGNNSTYSISQPTTTSSQGYGYAQTSSNGSNITSGYTGAKLVQLAVNSTLSAGQYWLGVFVANSTSSNNVGISQSFIGMNLPNTITALAPIGSYSSDFTSGTNGPLGIGGNWMLGLASFTSAAQTNLPVSVAMSALTQDVSMLPYMKMVSTR